MTPPIPSSLDANPNDNIINSNTNDVSKRAKSHWNFVKSLHATQKSSQNQLFKSGDNISLTTAEATFLNMITKSKLDDDHDKVVKSSFNSGGGDNISMSDADKDTTDGLDEISGSSRQRGTSQFTHLVQAAVAKERLRTAISDRLSELPDNEVKFLTKLVNNKSVSLEALENTVHVLNNDPLYNPNLRKDDNEEDDIADRRGNMRRQASEHSSRHFDKLMDKSEKTKAILPARRLNRKTSVAESSVWKLATVAEDNVDDKMDEEETLSSSRTFRRASRHEKNMFNLVRGESIKMVNSDVLKELEALEDDDGLPVKSTKRGDTMDPLCMAVPMEETPRISHKTLPSVKDEDEKMSLELDVESNKASMNNSFVAGDQTEEDVAPSLIACCGADMSIFNMLKEPSNEENEDINPISSQSFDKDSLQSKKQFLHLENERQAHLTNLTTWMGKPEDYPILGLGKKQNSKQSKSKSIAAIDEEEDVDDDDSGEDDNSDPLEPHVLSPLLMKCMREHLPYALREENFWLKYSLARDGASLEAIYSIMRHSSHTVLAIETTTGEVFGSFTSSPWRPNGNSYYGSCEAFVWQLRKSRQDSCNSLDEYILRESSLEVFQWTHKGNRNVQLSNTKKLFVGGGSPDVEEDVLMQDTNENEVDTDEEEWGMSIALTKELLHGTSSRCATFDSNPLNRKSEVFEIMNIEIWTLTPCMNEESAEELELGRTFVMGGTSIC